MFHQRTRDGINVRETTAQKSLLPPETNSMTDERERERERERDRERERERERDSEPKRETGRGEVKTERCTLHNSRQERDKDRERGRRRRRRKKELVSCGQSPKGQGRMDTSLPLCTMWGGGYIRGAYPLGGFDFGPHLVDGQGGRVASMRGESKGLVAGQKPLELQYYFGPFSKAAK